MAYVAIWRYAVRSEKAAEFLHAYGPEGAWCRLFRRAEGYVATQLVRDAADPAIFVTIDTWTSGAAYREFRARFAAEYEEIDRRCGEMTVREEKTAEGETSDGPEQDGPR